MIMTKPIIFFLAFVLLVLSCGTNSQSSGTVSSTTQSATLGFIEQKPIFDLIDYPQAFLEEEELDDWKDFEKLHQSMENLSTLNFKDIQVDLLALTSRLKKLTDKKLPDNLAVPQIKSRLKVVQMEVMKARYFTQHYREDSLIPSVERIYKHYNAFVSRMLSLKSETSVVVLDSLENN